MKKYLNLFLVLSLFLLAGCAAPVALAPLHLDAKAKIFQPVPDKSVIYVFRDDDYNYVELVFPLSIDGKIIGKLGIETYFVFAVSPGKHQMVTHSEYQQSTKQNHTFTLNIKTEPGKIYYVWNEINSSHGLGLLCCAPKLHLVDKNKGQAGVRAAKRAMSYATAP